MRDCRPDHGGGETGAGRFELLTPNPSSGCAMHNPHSAAAVEQDQCNPAPHESSYLCMKPFFKDNGRFTGVVAAKSSVVRALVAGALAVSAYGAVAREQASPLRLTQALKPCRSFVSLE